MNPGCAVAAAATFVWLGMVMAISFMEAPLKFRAPNVTVPMCVGIGRVVFRALNRSELALAAVIAVACLACRPPVAVIAGFVIALVMLVMQLTVVRPRLNRRSDQVLAGVEGPRSRVHYVYVGLEVVKVIALVGAGVLLLSG